MLILMPLTIKLRPALISDYQAIAKLHAESWRQNYRSILSDDYLNNDVYNDRLHYWHLKLSHKKAQNTITVAIINEALVGLCCTILNNDSVFGSLIDNLHISTSLQKLGIGKLLIIDAANSIINTAKNKKMYLWVYEINTNARKAYEHLGGIHFETKIKTGIDGTIAKSCRYIWDDVASII